MPHGNEGYVYHSYGPNRYCRHVVASVSTLRRYDTERPIALFCTEEHRSLLLQNGLSSLFESIDILPEEHRSVPGFKHNLHKFKVFERSLFLDSDMIWCRSPDRLWLQLAAYDFTATGIERADFFFGGPKGPGVLVDIILDRRRRTMRRFGLTHLPRIQAGMIFARDTDLTERVCRLAVDFFQSRGQTHFRSRLEENRSEESCEWSLAMAMSRLTLPVFPWFQGYNSPQLDFIPDLTSYDPNFNSVSCRYYTVGLIYFLRGFEPAAIRRLLTAGLKRLPGRGDFIDVVPFVLHFGWLRYKQPFWDFAESVWEQMRQPKAAVDSTGNGQTIGEESVQKQTGD